MKPWFKLSGLAVLGLVVLVGSQSMRAAEAPAPAPAPEEGWVSLFDGSSMSGWEMLQLNPAKKSQWEVKDGVIVGTGEASMLYSPKGQYENFRFRAEVKINDHGNSGMYVRTAKKPSFTDGYEIQINATHGDPIKTGSLYTMVHLFKSAAPPDTWFTQEVEVVTRNYRGKVLPHIKVWVYTSGKADNESLLYECIEHTNAFQSGYFAFQQHDPGSKVEIRKIEVKELPPSKK